jgi:hypothetical protein
VDLSTINPLFLDSTKPIGDKVVTNVELIDILLHDGDFVYFEMTDQSGFSQRFALQTIATKKSIKYKAEVWLKYQHEIQYRFVIESDGQVLYASAIQKTRAGHIISEKWEPCFDADLVVQKKIDKISLRRNELEKELRPRPEIKTHSSKSLLRPQFFEQIRTLLDDLM